MGQNQFTCITGAHAAGTVDVFVNSAFGSDTLVGAYTYVAPGGNTGSNTDSQKVAAVQAIGSKVVAETSGAAITSAIDGAISDGLGGNPGTPSTDEDGFGAPPFNLGAGSARTSRPGGFAAPSFIGATDHNGAGSAQREWKAWASVRGSGWDEDDRNPNAGGIDGHQINATFGLGRLLMPGVLVGIVGGYENFSYDFDGVDGRLEGDGVTAGGYVGWVVARNLRFDAAGTWTGLSYDATAGAATGSFDADRRLVSTGLTGTHDLHGLIIEPSARLYALWEHQDTWVDSLGTSQAERSFSVGRASSGAKLIAPWQAGAGITISPYAGLYADYRFSSDDALPVDQPLLGLDDGWTARATAGLAMTFDGGAQLSIDGELGGIGSGDQSISTVSGRVSVPF